MNSKLSGINGNALPYTAQDVLYLFEILGKALWYLQHLELWLTNCNTLKILQKKREGGVAITKTMANKILKKQQRLTLGPLIEAAKREKTIPGELVKRFGKLSKERNWIIHKCVIDESLALRNAGNKMKLFNRIEIFVEEAISLRNEIKTLAEAWCSNHGYDLEPSNDLAMKILRDAEMDR